MTSLPAPGRGVLVDTPVWSLALRRKAENLNASEQRLGQQLAELINGGRAHIIGAIRQEVLSGIRDHETFNRIRDYLRSFDEPRLGFLDYEEAAKMNNTCRSRGVAGSPIDFLVCAAAHLRGWHIFTLDQDFKRYAVILGIELHRGL